ncbi:MAG: DUF6062 family protein [Caldicoprobacterales bacterium]|jgi:hypothetical protein|nr:hypothetical protein [Clostridiales bacterium]
MKQQIHTFPLWDRIESRSECPFCEILEETQRSYISSMFRNMTTDKDFIQHLRSNSFCDSHFACLMEYRDKFGLALLLNQLITYEMADLESTSIKSYPIPDKKGPLQKLLERFLSAAPVKTYEEPPANRCALCTHLDEKESDYMATLIQLWGEDLHFRALYYNSQGFCLKHFYSTTEMAPNILEGKELKNFLDTSFYVQIQSMKRLNEDLKWFIKKFNYEYTNEPWKNSRDCLVRGIFKIKKKDPIN